jgi:Tfp pilus assembly protein PilN
MARRPRRIAGIELAMRGDGYVFRVVILENRKGELRLVDKTTANDLEAACQAIGQDTPIHLAVNVRGVLHKKMAGHEDDGQLLQMVLPNADTKDFYLQKESAAGFQIVSIIRRSLAEELVEMFTAAKCWVTAMDIGNFHLKYILNFLGTERQFSVSGYKLHFNDDNQLVGFEPDEFSHASYQTIELGEDKIEQFFLPAYAAALKGFIVDTVGIEVPLMLENKKELFHKQLFKRAAIGTLGFFLGVLLLNQLLYYNLRHHNQEHRAVPSKRQPELELLDSLREQINQQEKLIGQTNLNHSNRTSLYASQIGVSLPDGITLQEMAIFPLIGRPTDYKNGELWQYQMDAIGIRGRCDNSLIYNNWLQSLQKLPWVKSVEHLTYKEASYTVKEFEMRILVNGPSK